MLKNLFILFFSVNLCAVGHTNELELSRPNDSSSKGIWLGVAVWVACTIIPNMLKDLKKSEEAETKKAGMKDDTIAAPEKKEEAEKVVTKVNKWKRVVEFSLYAVFVVAYAYIIYSTVKEVTSAGKDLYSYLYPDAAKIARIEEAKKTIAVLDATRDFRNCLINNAKGLKNQEGIPISCEDCGQIFGSTAGIDAYQDMVTLFKKTYSE